MSSGSAYRGHGGGRGSNGRPVVTPESSSSSSDHSGWSRLSSHSSIGELSLDKTTATTATMVRQPCFFSVLCSVALSEAKNDMLGVNFLDRPRLQQREAETGGFGKFCVAY